MDNIKETEKAKKSKEIKERVIKEKFEYRYPTKLSRERRLKYLENFIPRKEGISDEEYIKAKKAREKWAEWNTIIH